MKITVFQSKKSWRYFLLLLFFLLAAVEAAAGEVDPLERFTGTHTRAVWIQEQGAGGDTFAFGRNFKLMGYDSRDGGKERPLLAETGNFYKPILTPDGKKVVVSNRLRHEMYLVDFQQGKKKSLGQGVAVDVWQDPASGTIWVYALAGEGSENKYFSTQPLVRFPLKKPKKRELVWNKTHLSWSNFDLSRDGKFAGGLFPWPHAGILLFEQDIWKQYGKGCWTALSPDNSAILWVFDGLHRNLNFVNPFTAEFWSTNINNAPGVDGFEVYHPRWSNHVRYLTMTGPYLEGEGGNKITGGGRKVEVFIGRFSPDLKKVEGWLQLTHNKLADFYPDFWLANGRESNFASPRTGTIAAAGSEHDMKWPANRRRLVFLWQDVLAANKLADDSLLGFSQFRVTPKQRARFNRFLEMELNRSGFVADWPAEKSLALLEQKGGAGLELLFTPATTTPADDGPVLRLQGKSCSEYLGLYQKGKDMLLQIGRPGSSPARIEVSGVLQQHRPVHIFVNLQGKQVRVYVNGRFRKEMVLTDTPLAFRKALRLLFGRPEGTGQGLNGTLSHVALYAGPGCDQEIARTAQLVTGALEARQEVPSIRFQGELVESSKIPAAEDLGAYQRALVVNRYRVVKPVQGTYSEKEILVAQWAVLDRTVLPETKEFTVGRTAELRVERFDQHPELEGERLMMDMFDPDLELYYQVDL